jgi:FkbM family methyltransferase
VRTPLGIIAPTLYSHHDMWTVNEVFCREDYRSGAGLGAVVDLGSNIGISALYFLTRNTGSRCWLYEPVPENVERLRRNLAGHEDRYRLSEAAVADRAGRYEFGVEETGRYGGIGADTGRSIEVEGLDVNDVLEEVLDEVPLIDVLKVDTEGLELATVEAVRPDLLRRIRTIFFEVDEEPEVHAEIFERSFANTTCSLRNRLLASA